MLNQFTEIKVQHLLVKVKDNDSEGAYQKAKMVLSEIQKGLSFSKAVKLYSDDVSTKSKQGHLGWTSMGKGNQTFELAAYSLGKGELSEPVRTPLGYHLRPQNRTQHHKNIPGVLFPGLYV